MFNIKKCVLSRIKKECSVFNGFEIGTLNKEYIYCLKLEFSKNFHYIINFPLIPTRLLQKLMVKKADHFPSYTRLVDTSKPFIIFKLWVKCR